MESAFFFPQCQRPAKTAILWNPRFGENDLNQVTTLLRSQEEEFSYGRYAATIDPEVLEHMQADRKHIDVICGPGDVVFFNQILMHRGGQNTSGILQVWV